MIKDTFPMIIGEEKVRSERTFSPPMFIGNVSFVIGIIQHSTLNIQHCYKALAHELTPSAVRAAISACTMAFTI